MSLHTGRKCSVVIPEGPSAAPRRQDLNTRQNLCSSNSNGRIGACLTTSSGNGSRSVGGLLAWSFNWFKVAVFPGSQCCAFQRPERAEDNSPMWHNISALAARISKSSRALRFDLLRETAAFSSHCSLGHDQPDPITFDETLKSLEQLGLWNLSSSRRSVQHHPWKHEEQLPSSFLVNFIITSRDLFQRNSQCVPEHANQEFRY